ncbi:MAG: heparan-alpha-glucosaminide N-acetyltransferase domain-containing protein [Acidobacteriota bacterium]|nr:heparan-alpha-glucosaminide N-acetyltransferase domain-containing protein [Acidobacteriota bacterium]
MDVNHRFVALDAFRGFTIAGMILVNTPGSWSHVYAPLRHAAWHGCTPTDLVFPFFLFITGTAMWFSMRKQREAPRGMVLKKLARRVAVIFLIGLALNAFPFVRDYSNLRFLGVLQRIALAYGMAALLCLWLNRRALWWVMGGTLIGYWILLAAFGGSDPYALETNLVRTIDLAVLGEAHLWRGTGIAFDPEGLLSTLPAVVSVLFGYQTGASITGRDRLEVLRPLFYWGFGSVAVGWVWGLVFPVNKALWTSSYVVLTTGWALLTLGLFILLIDLRGYKRWAQPFLVFGMNSLFSYVLSILWVLITIHLIRLPGPKGETLNGYTWLYQQVFKPLAGPLNGSLLFALFHVALIWTAALLLWRKRIFIKI